MRSSSQSHPNSAIRQGPIACDRRSTRREPHPSHPHHLLDRRKGSRRSHRRDILRKERRPPPPDCHLKHRLTLAIWPLRHPIPSPSLHPHSLPAKLSTSTSI